MDKVPTDFRRVTIRVNQIEPALAVYRDILGMQVHYDEEIVVSGKAMPAPAPNARARLVVLKCNDPEVGMLGFLQYLEPSPNEGEPLPPGTGDRQGATLFVMQNENVEETCQKLAGAAGVKIFAEPHVTELPRGDGGVLKVLGASFFDPNGYLVELNQVIE
ncbi:MAG: VOC family protein [Lysobacterales bacterium]|jgi:catechol 2,3-dioxygenase-like lactoylglutathione lyase family enzyme